MRSSFEDIFLRLLTFVPIVFIQFGGILVSSYSVLVRTIILVLVLVLVHIKAIIFVIVLVHKNNTGHVHSLLTQTGCIRYNNRGTDKTPRDKTPYDNPHAGSVVGCFVVEEFVGGLCHTPTSGRLVQCHHKLQDATEWPDFVRWLNWIENANLRLYVQKCYELPVWADQYRILAQ